MNPVVESAVPGGTGASEYVELKRRVDRLQLTTPDPSFYLIRAALHVLLFAVSVTWLYFDQRWPVQAVCAVLMALTAGQLGILGHDAGHYQVFHRRRANELIGFCLFSLLNGVSFLFWVEKHNRHHAFPNQLEADPDVDMHIHAYCDEQLRDKRGLTRFLVKYQAVLFFPSLLLQVFSLRYDSFVFLARNRHSRRITLEWTLLVLHHLLFLSLLTPALGLLGAAVFYVLFQALLGFYVGLLFAPNHLGMPILPEDTPLGFLRRQVLTSRGLSTHPVTDYFFSSLGYQIEHHLFPHAPLSKLPSIRGLAVEFCRERGVPYHLVNPVRAFVEVVSALHKASAPLREER